MLSPQILPSVPSSNMDVDNEIFQHVVRLSDGTSPEPFPSISDADLEISRHHIPVFMSTHLAYELLPESRKVMALGVELPVKQAFHILHDQGISMAPLWDFSKAKFLGVLSALDVILIMRESNSKNVSRGDIRANTKCKLLHWCVDELIVVEGRIASTDPNAKVHHVVLGGSSWKVWVDKVLVEKVDLIRPNDKMHFLDDAIGSTVAWLSKFIVLCD